MARLLSEIRTEFSSIFPASAPMLALNDFIISSVFCFIAFSRKSVVNAVGSGWAGFDGAEWAALWAGADVSIST